MTEETPPQSTGMTAAEVTSLVNLFNGMLLAMEGRLSAKMDDMAKAETDRWTKHDQESQRTIAAWDKRVTTIETTLSDHLIVANKHFAKEHDEEIANQARVKPVLTIAGYVSKNWKTILLVLLAVMAFLGFSADIITDLGTHLGVRF